MSPGTAVRTLLIGFTGLLTCLHASAAWAQAAAKPPKEPIRSTVPGWGSPVNDRQVLVHLLFDQLEGRSNGSGSKLRWDGQGWVGTDKNKLWFKSEGSLAKGKVGDGDHELLYDRPIPHLRYFDVQAGVREDLDSGRRRTWGAVGIEGLAPYFFEFEPTLYFGPGGRLALRVNGSYDLLLTQRLILQPQLEINLYGKNDLARRIGAGLSDLDSGLRLRYEFHRKFAPYVGFAYSRKFSQTASLARQAGERVRDPRFVFGMRLWQ